jgi:hypothetical protein
MFCGSSYTPDPGPAWRRLKVPAVKPLTTDSFVHRKCALGAWRRLGPRHWNRQIRLGYRDPALLASASASLKTRSAPMHALCADRVIPDEWRLKEQFCEPQREI